MTVKFHSNINEYDTKPKENNKYYKGTNELRETSNGMYN